MKRRILVAEDVSTVRHLLGIVLNKAGFHVEFASDGKEALQKVLDGNFDLIITDQYMPGITGEQLAVVISRTQPATPLILITGNRFDPESRASEGVRARLYKPVTPEDLLAAVNEALGG